MTDATPDNQWPAKLEAAADHLEAARDAADTLAARFVGDNHRGAVGSWWEVADHLNKAHQLLTGNACESLDGKQPPRQFYAEYLAGLLSDIGEAADAIANASEDTDDEYERTPADHVEIIAEWIDAAGGQLVGYQRPER